jgi:hypothetical protein
LNLETGDHCKWCHQSKRKDPEIDCTIQLPVLYLSIGQVEEKLRVNIFYFVVISLLLTPAPLLLLCGLLNSGSIPQLAAWVVKPDSANGANPGLILSCLPVFTAAFMLAAELPGCFYTGEYEKNGRLPNFVPSSIRNTFLLVAIQFHY